MLKNFFNLFKDEDEGTPENIVEKRRQEKVTDVTVAVEPAPKAKPKILVPEDVVIEKSVAAEPEKAAKPAKKTAPHKKPAPVKKTEKVEEEYKMSQVISPIFGAKSDSDGTVEASPAKKKKKVVHPDDGLINVFSPFYVPVESEDEMELDEAVKVDPEVKSSFESVLEQEMIQSAKESAEAQKAQTVEDNIRNIAKLIDDTDADLKIIEERTGEFRLDFKDHSSTDGSVTEEIKDDTSLEELMNLYDKYKN